MFLVDPSGESSLCRDSKVRQISVITLARLRPHHRFKYRSRRRRSTGSLLHELSLFLRLRREKWMHFSLIKRAMRPDMSILLSASPFWMFKYFVQTTKNVNVASEAVV